MGIREALKKSRKEERKIGRKVGGKMQRHNTPGREADGVANLPTIYGVRYGCVSKFLWLRLHHSN